MNKILPKDNQNVIFTLIWLVCLIELNYFLIRGTSRNWSSIPILLFAAPLVNLLYCIFSSIIIGTQDKANRWPTRRYILLFGCGFLTAIVGDFLCSSLF